jgi:Na+/H+ antiporter NhaD/arsenite permease-like protein
VSSPILALSLLGAGVVGVVAPPRSLPSWAVPILAALAAVVFGVIGPDEALAALG